MEKFHIFVILAISPVTFEYYINIYGYYELKNLVIFHVFIKNFDNSIVLLNVNNLFKTYSLTYS